MRSWVERYDDIGSKGETLPMSVWEHRGYTKDLHSNY